MGDKSQFFRGTLEGCILKIINDNEVYGYEIAEKLKGFGLDEVSEGTIYPLLLRLEKNGLVSSEKKESAFGPKRKYYKLTILGKKELKEFFKTWQELKNSVDRIFEDYGGDIYE
ncbi:PadR family transcriptional regulator [Hathewaya histolytica]|uniref:Putative transcriptional regulator n=1 Tax=Hathewaya histolytica TaxID=1498 RepID=A0A4U9RUV9_HATHI|nr:PadR family transcriptional regulator [Hathewaya histolytica]VTQ96009.1 putative transcriptional regulator [Hathewaya histolytica]